MKFYGLMIIGYSEYITCNKRILKDFLKQKTQVKRANNFICKLQGIKIEPSKVKTMTNTLDLIKFTLPII